MAYIAKEAVAAMRDKIRAALPAFKFVVKNRHGYTVVVHFIAGPIDFGTVQAQVNDRYFAKHYEDKPLAVAAFQTVMNIIRDENISSFLPEYYVSLNIGAYKRPYQIKTLAT